MASPSATERVGLLTVDELRTDLAPFAFLLGSSGYLLNVDIDEP